MIGLVFSEKRCLLPFRYKVAPAGFPSCSVTLCLEVQVSVAGL